MDTGIDDDSNDTLLKLISTTCPEGPGTVTVDLAKYNIKVHTDKDDKSIWLPLTTVADIFINPSNYYAEYVGDAVYFIDADTLNNKIYVT
ncbi:MAG: hypothetical protein J6O90_06105, partial [Candidatus Methanomethylophilaceae archaeon]|nr:hypothetical protein [Candidatus Methanomethylophilaceae archaeon]